MEPFRNLEIGLVQVHYRRKFTTLGNSSSLVGAAEKIGGTRLVTTHLETTAIDTQEYKLNN